MGKYDVEKKVELYMEEHQMLNPGESVLAGVSGGADSVCLFAILLQICKRNGNQLHVIHVDHGVREDSSLDAKYVEELCRRENVPFYLEKVDMVGYAKERGLSSEEAGRALRYKLFASYKEKLDISKIAVAHNENDCAETMLFNLFRGTGLKGLSSIQPVREDIIRPILCLTREEIEDYLAQTGLEFRTDSTNASDAYARNRIRHHIIPYAQAEVNEQVVSHMFETAKQLSQIERYLEKQGEKAYKECVTGEEDALRIDLKSLKMVDSVLQNMVLLNCFSALTPYRKDITSTHIEALIRFADTTGSKKMQLPYGLTAKKEYDILWLLRESEEEKESGAGVKGMSSKDETDGAEYCLLQAPCSVEQIDSLRGEIYLEGLGKLSYELVTGPDAVQEICQNIPENQYTKCFDYDKITRVVTVRKRRTGDYIFCDANMHKKTIKDYMINEKIPKTQRDNLWLIADGDHIIWIPGFRISEGCKINENTKRILRIRIQEENNG